MARSTALKILLDVHRLPEKSKIRDHINNSKLDPKDKRLVWELVNGVLKNLLLLEYILSKYIRKSPGIHINMILQLGAYQMFFTRIPDYAVVDECVKLAKKSKHRGQAKFVNAVLRNAVRNQKEIREEISQGELPDSIRFSIPEWMVRKVREWYGKKESKKIFSIVSRPPLMTVRIRENKTSKNQFMSALSDQGIGFIPVYESYWINIIDKDRFWESEILDSGYCAVQDYSSGIACRLFDFEKHAEIKLLDMCAAPGGKTMQILDTLNGRGYVIANELSLSRSKILVENLDRSGYDNYKITNDDARVLKGQYSHILIDAPCSGLGTLRKNADLRWNKTMDDIINFHNLQKEMLNQAAKITLIGGEIVYSTCSIAPKENEDVLTEFLNNNPDFKVSKTKNNDFERFYLPSGACLVLPNEFHDGAFSVKLIKFR